MDATDPENLPVLLIYRKNVWDLPKGKLEKDESIEECARREVAEEIGSVPPEITGRVGETYHEYKENGEQIGKTTHWFAMVIDPETDFEPERQEGIERVTWFPHYEAVDKVGYDNLSRLLHLFKQWYIQNCLSN